MDFLGIKLALKRASKRKYIQDKRRDATTKLSHWCLKTAMCIMLHFNHDITYAVLWLRSKQRRGARLEADGDEESLRKYLEDFFFSCNVDVLASCTDPEHSPLLPSCIKTVAACVCGKTIDQLASRAKYVSRTFRANSNHDRSFQ